MSRTPHSYQSRFPVLGRSGRLGPAPRSTSPDGVLFRERLGTRLVRVQSSTSEGSTRELIRSPRLTEEEERFVELSPEPQQTRRIRSRSPVFRGPRSNRFLQRPTEDRSNQRGVRRQTHWIQVDSETEEEPEIRPRSPVSRAPWSEGILQRWQTDRQEQRELRRQARQVQVDSELEEDLEDTIPTVSLRSVVTVPSPASGRPARTRVRRSLSRSPSPNTLSRRARNRQLPDLLTTPATTSATRTSPTSIQRRERRSRR